MRRIEEDLQQLLQYSNGLVLYSTDNSTKNIFEIANNLELRAVILGVWTVTDKDEIYQAVELSRSYSNLLRAIAVGRECYWGWFTHGRKSKAIVDSLEMRQ